MTEATALLVQGVVLGLAVAAPVGPIGLLCLRRTLERGFLAGLSGGAGTALADACYAAAAAFGLSGVSALLLGAQGPIRLLGGGFLLWLGLRGLLGRPATREAAGAAAGYGGLFASTFVLTLANPATILSFAAMFAGLGLAGQNAGPAAAAALVFGVFAGSLLWWVAFSGALAMARRRVGPRVALWINRLAGAVLVGFAAAILAGAL